MNEMEARLREIGTRLEVPAPRDITGAVLTRLAAPPPRPRRRLVTATVVTVVAAVLALVTAMVVSPTVRAAVYDLLRIGGVEIHQNEPAPPVHSEVPLPGERTVSLDEARAAAGFPLKVPARLGEPDSVQVIGAPPQVVSMRFGAVRVDQFDGGLDPFFEKFAQAEDVHEVTVDGARGIWVDRPHVVIYTGRDGSAHEAAPRLAGSTLIWESGGITYRVEGDLTQSQALAIAAAMR